MMALGEAAVDLAWLCPCAGSLAALTRPDGPSVWSEVRFDPGCVLLLAQAANRQPNASLPSLIHDPSVLEAAFERLGQDNSSQGKSGQGKSGFVDWAQPGAERIYQSCVRQAQLASALAGQIQGCDPDRAWAGGLLVPLGWLAVAAVSGPRIADFLEHPIAEPGWQQKAWGLDATSIARRLARAWRLPPWLSPLVGHLGLHVSIAEKLGADPLLFQVVQLAVGLTQQKDRGLALPLGNAVGDLQTSLRLSNDQLIGILENCQPPPARSWESPAKQPLLADLLRLALRQNRHNEEAWAENLQRDLDRLQQALEEQWAGEKERLQNLKLAALAELAAGAGHEINNPLAVISGQAQYLLKQLQQVEETLAEETTALGLLESIKAKFAAALHKIVGQTQRVHNVLTDLMQFARPAPAHPQILGANSLVKEVAGALQEFAQERQVRLEVQAPSESWGVNVDAAQMRTVLAGLVRNAIEAAPSEGWARLSVENGDGTLKFIIEDNGQGPSPAAQEHLFDPFYSGRSAGRGRGLGLATAWRLAKQQGGEVRFEGHQHGQTRFVLALPAADLPAPLPQTNGHHPEGNGRHVAALTTADFV